MNGILTKYHVSKNLWSYNPSTTRNGVTLSYDGTKINFSGQCNGSDNIETNISLPAGTYTIAANANRSPVTDSTYCILIYKSGVVECGISNTRAAIGKNSFTLENDESNIKMRIRIQNGVDYDGFYIQPMMNTGSEILPFEPHGDTWNDIPYSKLETATDVVTSLPVKVYGDGETDISLLLKGNTETSGTPSPSNPVTIEGVGEETANLINVYEITKSDDILFSTLDLPKSLPIGQYTFSANMIPEEGVTDSRISFRDSDGNSVGNMRVYYSSTGRSTGTISITGVAAKLYIYGAYSSSVYAAISYTDIMLNEGEEALPFEPYGKYKISILKGLTALTPMYLTGQLLKVGNYSDDVNSIGTATYNVAKYEFTGEENISIANGVMRYTIDGYKRTTDWGVLCTHYNGVNNITRLGDLTAEQIAFLVSSSGNNYLYIYDSTYYNDVTGFKMFLAAQYAAGTPVTVYYVLATATTESVTVPEITTTGGEVTIDVDTTVKPSELDLTYHGWHEHQPLKRENGQWE